MTAADGALRNPSAYPAHPAIDTLIFDVGLTIVFLLGMMLLDREFKQRRLRPESSFWFWWVNQCESVR